MTPMTERNPFPITTAQRDKGNLDSKGAENIALLQDLGHATTSTAVQDQLMFNNASIIGDLSGLLALAFADDAAFTEAFPDALMRSPRNTVNDTCLPGLRQDDAGQWNRIAPDDATLTERRDYVRRSLIVNAAKRILDFASRPITDKIAVTAPGKLHSIYCLTGVAGDVCRTFDPDFMKQFEQPLLVNTPS